MRYRAEKTTKQIENEELSRLTEATGQGGEGRPTTQLDPDALRALLGTDQLPPVAAPRVVEPLPPAVEASPVVEAPPVVETPPAVEAPPVDETPSPRRWSRWLVAAICLALGAVASFAVFTMR